MNTRLFDSWTWRRYLAGSDVKISNRQLFILPTRMGFVFTLLLFTLLMAAINYENGLSYALTFILAALGQVSMLYTHRNLLGLRFMAGNAAAVFAGQVARFQVTLRNDTARPRHQVQLTCDGEVFATVDLGPHAQQRVILERPATKRGLMDIPDIKAQTRFPIGLLYTWSTRICLEQQCIVYPHPSPPGQLPLASSGEDRLQHEGRGSGDDFTGFREYRKGDSLKQVHWKAVAQGRGMQTKLYGSGGGEDLWLDWGLLAGRDTEQRLQQLCRWVLDAEEMNVNYGLRLPDQEIAPNSGVEHQHRCLRALALYQDHE